MSLRIVAGTARGTLLRTPRGSATRPTLGRVRDSVFMILTPRLEGARVADVFAGSGALGLEALSRGAAQAVFIEQARPALESLRANIEKLRWGDRARVVARDAMVWLAASAPEGGPFDLIVMDPPYGRDAADRAMSCLSERLDAFLAPEGRVVVQVGRRDALQATYGALRHTRTETYSQTRVEFFGR